MADPLRREASLADLNLWALHRYPDRVAIVQDDRRWTYRQVLDRVSQLMAVLEARGYGRGHGLVQLSGNNAESLFVLFAAVALAGRQGSLHPLGSLDDQAFIIEDAEASILVFEPGTYDERARELAERLPDVDVLSLGPSPIGTDLLALADAEPVQPVVPRADADDICTVAYSGGTTGRPKGVVQRHRTVVEMTNLICLSWQLPEEIRFLAVTPISHAAVCFVLPTWLNGGTVYLQRGFDPEEFYANVERHRITLTFLVPTIIYVLLDHPATKAADVSSIETIVYGASPIAPSRLREALDVFGPVFVQLYGQAEAPATVTTLRKEDHDPDRPELMGSCGQPLPGVTVALLDDDDEEVPLGEVGEICVRGRIVTDGYWKQPEMTAELFRSDWLHTGDMARQDEAGYVYIVDRKKDMIITGGFNVFPREIEDVLTAHPDVSASVAIGVPDERWGEAVKAVVVPRPGAHPDPDELIALVRDKKGVAYAPKSIDFVDELPVTAIGKPDRKTVRARFWQGQDRQVH